MNRTVSLHEAAEDELNEAADFYDIGCPGLGMSFLNDVQKTIEDVTIFSEAGPLLKGRVRRRLLRKFPYTVIYSFGKLKFGFSPLRIRNGGPSIGMNGDDLSTPKAINLKNGHIPATGRLSFVLM